MSVTVERRVPSARCFDCGSSEVRGLCHHCWRPGCAQHVRAAPGWAEKLFGGEGYGPGLKNRPAWHCAGCAHWRPGRWLETGAAGTGVVAAGLVLLTVSPVLGAVLAILGAGTVGWACTRIRRHSGQARDSLPVALHPRVSEVRVTERLRTTITLDARGDYQVDRNAVSGEMTATLTYDRNDGRRLRRSRDRRGRSPGEATRYSAGVLVRQGRVGVSELDAHLVIGTQDDAADVLELADDDAPAACGKKIREPYTFPVPPELEAGPLWVTPSIAPESEKHVLELDIQWPDPDLRTEPGLSLDVIESLELQFPVGWGKVEWASHGMPVISTAGAGGQPSRQITWKHLVPSAAEASGRRMTLKVEFEDEILARDSVSGSIVAVMKGSLSGISGLRMYSALGELRTSVGTTRVRTRISADFSLSLANIMYQSLRVFPDRSAAEETPGAEVIDAQVIPGDDMIITLTNALGDAEFYVKRIAENPPRSGGKSDVMHRSWDIAGRRYDGVYPVDFHMEISGEERHEGDVRPASGHTKVRISVQGAYVDDEMRIIVDDVWASLREVTSRVLKGLE